jgi:uncharacterized protein (TIGR02186 family)
MFVKKNLRTTVLLYAAAVLFVLLPGKSVWALTAEVAPQNISISLFYHGAKLSIKGKSNPTDDLLIKISSEPTDAHMKYKGKAAGLFWMKMGDISFENVPSTYLLATSGNINSLLPREDQIKEGLGFEAIKAGTKIESSAADMDPDKWIAEFIKLKKAENLYMVAEGAINMMQGAQENEYELDMKWPYQAAPGTYNIEVLAVRDGAVVDRTATNLTVARTGIVAKLTNLAFNHPAVYGIIAIVVAMLAGFAVGALFKKGGGAH